MKKLILVGSLMTSLMASLVMGLNSPAFAGCDYSTFCPSQAYDLTSKPGRIISKGTGATFLAEKVGQRIIKRELRKATSQNFDVRLKSYSLKDLYNGRFKSLRISGKNLNIEGVHISSLDVKTLCDFNYIERAGDSIKFKENMALGFATEITDADLTKTMQTNGYLDKLNCVNVEGCGVTFFKLSNASVNIKNNKLYFKVKVTSQIFLVKPLDIVIATDLKVEDGRIVLTKIDFGNLPKGIDLSKVAYNLNAMNPLLFSLNVLENEDTKMCIKNVDIIGDRIIVKGDILIPRNTIRTQK